jgi:hypothetical protein
MVYKDRRTEPLVVTRLTVAQLKFYLGDFLAKPPAVAAFAAFWASFNFEF